jgi:hypothetical protein
MKDKIFNIVMIIIMGTILILGNLWGWALHSYMSS